METNSSKDTLQKLNKDLLIGVLDEPLLLETYQYYLTKDLLEESSDICLALLISTDLVEQCSTVTPVVKIASSYLKNRLLMELNASTSIKTDSPENFSKEPKKDNNNKDDLGSNFNGNIDYDAIESDVLGDEEVKKIFLNKYKQFVKTPQDTFKLPPIGEEGNILVKDNSTIPGKTYSLNFKVDHEGKVLSMITPPILKAEPESYDSIYEGLLGQIMEYQKVK